MHYDPKRTTLEQRMKNLRLRSGDQTKRCLEFHKHVFNKK